jgi:hypothetical protein
MKQFSGFDEAKEAAKYSPSEKLPTGAYVCEVKNVQYVAGENGNSDRIDILFDISEGDYKDFYKKKYDNDDSEDKKWKGRKSIYIPKDDGSEKDGWTKNTFAKWTNAFEDSNKGYKWDWKEEKWKKLKVGIVFGETGNVIEGREVLYTEPRFPVAVDKVRDGSAPAAKFVGKNGYTGIKQNNSNSSAGSESWMNIPEGKEEEIPFN